jgi:hypothetical protein
MSFSSFLNMQLDRTVIPPAELLAVNDRPRKISRGQDELLTFHVH